MVAAKGAVGVTKLLFQYSLCRVVLMVAVPDQHMVGEVFVFQYSLCRVVLMVPGGLQTNSIILLFQYSLCRVVLMVASSKVDFASVHLFQYSLCRVVLMVTSRAGICHRREPVSVLALSSRFDGRATRRLDDFAWQVSVLALSSRFDGLIRTLLLRM